jgi:hypothetical protein
MRRSLYQPNRYQNNTHQAEQNRIHSPQAKITTDQEKCMRTEHEIRTHQQLIRQIIDMPGEVPQGLMVLPHSHWALLSWVLDDNTTAAAQVAAMHKNLLEGLSKIKKQLDAENDLHKTNGKPLNSKYETKPSGQSREGEQDASRD